MELTISNVKKFNKIYKPVSTKEWINKWIENLSVEFDKKD